ncbi:MAG: hypothetical protein QW841_01650 [Candidatus Aenigmatarchaeota archaeon]
MKKGLAIPIYVVVLVLLIGIIAVAAITIIMSWLSANRCIGLQSSCANARIMFCEKWHDQCSDFNCDEPEWDSSLKTCELTETGKGTQEVACTKPNATECSEAFKED